MRNTAIDDIVNYVNMARDKKSPFYNITVGALLFRLMTSNKVRHMAVASCIMCMGLPNNYSTMCSTACGRTGTDCTYVVKSLTTTARQLSDTLTQDYLTVCDPVTVDIAKHIFGLNSRDVCTDEWSDEMKKFVFVFTLSLDMMTNDKSTCKLIPDRSPLYPLDTEWIDAVDYGDQDISSSPAIG